LPDSRPEPHLASPAAGRLEPRRTGDGSLTLWSERFGECFHSGSGAYAEAQQKFVLPAGLPRFATGSSLRVLDFCVGLGYNSGALLEAAEQRGLQLEWIGLELDSRPLALALADAGFRSHWQPDTLAVLQDLRRQGHWCTPAGSRGHWRLGDARRQLPALVQTHAGHIDLVLHDAFSPGRCPELWSVEVLSALATLLKPQGRLLTYCAAAAVRRGLQLAGLEVASIAGPAEAIAPGRRWCHGTAASPTALPLSGAERDVLQPLSNMEREHLLTRAAEPYRDPTGSAAAPRLQAERAERQQLHRGESTSAWRRRWGLERRA
jgi:tRNA U34 5-methylaminomethyl-2-thiouridine-forming methyltransferase MnmC